MSDIHEENLAKQIVIADPTVDTEWDENLPIKVVFCDGNGVPYTPS